MSGCVFYCCHFIFFFNYFPNCDLNLSVKTRQQSESFKQERCDFLAHFPYCPCLPTPALVRGGREGSTWQPGGSHTPLLSRPGLRLIFYHPKATISREEKY